MALGYCLIIFHIIHACFRVISMEVDIIQKKLGGYGCYQMLVYTLLGLMYMRGAWHTFNIIFLGAVPAHTCTVANRTVDNSLQIVAGECDVTLMVSNATHTVNETVACSAWQYDSMHSASSIVSEVCLIQMLRILMKTSPANILVLITFSTWDPGFEVIV